MKQTDELLKMVERPKTKKRPSNFGLWLALIFFNFAALVVDIISGITVYKLTSLWGYGLMVFLAGFVPLLMHEVLYTRPFANRNQQVASIIGAATAVLSIVVVGVLSAYANSSGYNSVPWAATASVVFVVVAVVWHGLLAAYYFYTDDGIKAEHVETETMAWHKKKVANLERAREILLLTKNASTLQKELESEFGSPRAVAAVLRQLNQDSDGDGIPDIVDPTPFGEKPVMSAPPKFSGNGSRDRELVMTNPTTPKKP